MLKLFMEIFVEDEWLKGLEKVVALIQDKLYQ